VILKRKEAGGKNRSVMPVDIIGSTRVTIIMATSKCVHIYVQAPFLHNRMGNLEALL